MHDFQMRGGKLFCEGVALEDIAKQVGTPTYVYSTATLERHVDALSGAFAGHKHRLCFSVKANSNLGVLATLFAKGVGADIVSGGELERVLRAGGDAKHVVFSGVGKRQDELELALSHGILAFNVESVEELELLEAVAKRAGKVAPVSLRVNPDVDPKTHPYISTGLKRNKFGVPFEVARKAYERAAASPYLCPAGVDCHIGSQLLSTGPFREALEKVAHFIVELAGAGIKLEHVDIGGGLGISYKSDDAPPDPAEYAQVVCSALAPALALGMELVLEPGRVIVGNAGILLTRVQHWKQGEEKHFCVVDAAMNDLMRPALYQSHHELVAVNAADDGSRRVADVVGPICETGDFLARDREISAVPAGGLFAVMSAGAYGFSMASNYNTRPRAAEVLVRGSAYEIVRPRETIDDLLRSERVPAWLSDTVRSALPPAEK